MLSSAKLLNPCLRYRKNPRRVASSKCPCLDCHHSWAVPSAVHIFIVLVAEDAYPERSLSGGQGPGQSSPAESDEEAPVSSHYFANRGKNKRKRTVAFPRSKRRRSSSRTKGYGRFGDALWCSLVLYARSEKPTTLHFGPSCPVREMTLRI